MIFSSLESLGINYIKGISFDRDGLMKMDEGDLLPIIDNPTNPFVPDAERTGGDVRAAENPALTTVHTIWLREHNRIASELKRLLPEAGDEELYQSTRRIVVAEMQNVVYGQWLSEMIGPQLYAELGLDPTVDSTYDPETDPTIMNEFATAAFRLGHTLLQGVLFNVVSDLEGGTLKSMGSTFRLQDSFFNSTLYNKNMESVLNGLQFQNPQSFDANIVTDVTEGLFQNIERAGDLIARNLQRGRDHGLPGYNDFRKVSKGN